MNRFYKIVSASFLFICIAAIPHAAHGWTLLDASAYDLVPEVSGGGPTIDLYNYSTGKTDTISASSYTSCPTDDTNYMALSMSPLSSDNIFYPEEIYIPTAQFYWAPGPHISPFSGGYSNNDLPAQSGTLATTPALDAIATAQIMKNTNTGFSGLTVPASESQINLYPAFEKQLVRTNGLFNRWSGLASLDYSATPPYIDSSPLYSSIFQRWSWLGYYAYFMPASESWIWPSTFSEFGIAPSTNLTRLTPSVMKNTIGGLVGTVGNPGMHKMLAFFRTISNNIFYTDYHLTCHYYNVQTYSEDYQIMNNSHIAYVVFVDTNGNGIMDNDEKAVAYDGHVQDPIGGSYTNLSNTACNTGSINPLEIYGPYNTDYNLRNIEPYIKTTYPVARGAYEETYGLTYWYYRTANNNGGGGSSAYINFDSDHRMIIDRQYFTPYCGTANTGDPVYNGTVVPPSNFTNKGLAYYVIPVNPAITEYYTVGLSTSTLPKGWTRTTPDQNIIISTEGAVVPVYMGIKPDVAPQPGMCGAATSTPSTYIYPSSGDLCTDKYGAYTGSTNSSNFKDTGPGFTWDCTGAYNGTTVSCSVAKCGTGQNFCAAYGYCIPQGEVCGETGVCGGATTIASLNAPTDNLCNTYNGNSPPQGGGSVYSWDCYGYPNQPQLKATCYSNKCELGLDYCASDNTCKASCGNSATNLISNTKLNPGIISNKNQQCTIHWDVNSGSGSPVTCTINGVTVSANAGLGMSASAPSGLDTLTCTDGSVSQTVQTRCTLNPTYREI